MPNFLIMIKNIIKMLLLLSAQPARAWSTIADKQESNEEFLSRFLYPLIGTATLCAFVGSFFKNGETQLQDALKDATIILTSLFGGFYMAAFMVKQLSDYLQLPKNSIGFYQRYTGYCFSLIVAVTAILELFPDFFFLKIGELYIIYIIFESHGNFLQVEESKRVRFTVIASLIVITSPYIIETLLYKLMPGMRAL